MIVRVVSAEQCASGTIERLLTLIGQGTAVMIGTMFQTRDNSTVALHYTLVMCYYCIALGQ